METFPRLFFSTGTAGSSLGEKRKPGEDRPISKARKIPAAERAPFREEYMDITAVNRSVQGAPASVAPAPVDHGAENREVVRAVQALNRSEMFGQDNQLRFQKDQQTGRMIVKVVNQ